MTNQTNILKHLENFANKQLKDYILPFWKEKAIDTKYGGFYGQINNDDSIEYEATKGLILNARILWTFSAVYQKTKDSSDLAMANRAYDYITNHFYDAENKGYFWSLNYDGSPHDLKKQIYAQAFVIYGLSEYYKVNNNKEVLQKAIDLFYLIEKHSFDTEKNGYFEARNREWQAIDDTRLSEKDMNVDKSMNTHLHILEAYANLHTVYKNPQLKQQLENLINIFIDIIIDKDDTHQILFFDKDWNPQSTLISYGHDIETSWLLHEASLISENKTLIDKVTPISIRMSEEVQAGIAPSGAVYYESDRAGLHEEKEIEWWAQAEGIVGFLNVYVLTRKKENLEIAEKIAHFIEQFIVDKKHGEWFSRVTEQGTLIPSHEKAGFWKCPYHNARACLEILHRIEILTNT